MSYIQTSKPLKISRANIQLMKECPRCFWMYKHQGIGRPQGYPYTLSIAVDQLLKAEFDEYRERGEMHPVLIDHFDKLSAGNEGLMEAHLYPDHVQLQKWRNNFEGLKYYDDELDATLFGAVDDMLEFNDGSLAVIDYKSSGAKEVSVYDDYQMQMDTYTYILECIGYKTARKAYFVFYQVDKTDGFRGRLPFKGLIREVITNPTYIRDLFVEAVQLARSDVPPQSSTECQHCNWAEHRTNLENRIKTEGQLKYDEII